MNQAAGFICLIFFRHILYNAPNERSSLCSCYCNLPAPVWLETTAVRPNHTSLRAIESHLRSLITGLFYAPSQENWCSIVDLAMSKKSMPWRLKRECDESRKFAGSVKSATIAVWLNIFLLIRMTVTVTETVQLHFVDLFSTDWILLCINCWLQRLTGWSKRLSLDARPTWEVTLVQNTTTLLFRCCWRHICRRWSNVSR